jgi:hypothetical protein
MTCCGPIHARGGGGKKSEAKGPSGGGGRGDAGGVGEGGGAHLQLRPVAVVAPVRNSISKCRMPRQRRSSAPSQAAIRHCHCYYCRHHPPSVITDIRYPPPPPATATTTTTTTPPSPPRPHLNEEDKRNKEVRAEKLVLQRYTRFGLLWGAPAQW